MAIREEGTQVRWVGGRVRRGCPRHSDSLFTFVGHITILAHSFFVLRLGVVIPSPVSANRSVAKACTAPAKMLSNALHSVGTKRYKIGASKAETAPALIKR